MITITKLKEYEEHHGVYDAFYLQKVKNGTNIISDEEWFLVDVLLQDMRLVNKKLTSTEFSENLVRRLKESFSNEETINYFKTLGNKEG
jgi:tRNA U34 2-thiouridine synthase MnmA/TrmU